MQHKQDRPEQSKELTQEQIDRIIDERRHALIMLFQRASFAKLPLRVIPANRSGMRFGAGVFFGKQGYTRVADMRAILDRCCERGLVTLEDNLFAAAPRLHSTPSVTAST